MNRVVICLVLAMIIAGFIGARIIDAYPTTAAGAVIAIISIIIGMMGVCLGIWWDNRPMRRRGGSF